MNGTQNKLLVVYANSSIAYVLAFLSIFIPTQVLIHFVAGGFDIPTKFNYFKLIFPIADHSFLWTQLSVSCIYAASPFLALICAFIVFRIHIKKSGNIGQFSNLYLIWLYAHCINIFFGGLLIGIPLIKDFGYLPNWLYASSETEVYLILVGALGLLVNGILLRKAFNTICFNEKYFSSPYHSLVFKSMVAFFPAISGIVLFIIFKFPDNTVFTKLLHLTVLIQLCSVAPYTSVHIPISEQLKNFKFSYKPVIILIVIFGLFTAWKNIHNLYIY
jgi:hypothetical protein